MPRPFRAIIASALARRRIAWLPTVQPRIEPPISGASTSDASPARKLNMAASFSPAL
jgi:hypothetical protein